MFALIDFLFPSPLRYSRHPCTGLSSIGQQNHAVTIAFGKFSQYNFTGQPQAMKLRIRRGFSFVMRFDLEICKYPWSIRRCTFWFSSLAVGQHREKGFF